MTRGGYREGSGRKPSWNNSETQLVRIPKVLVGPILNIARKLDSGEIPVEVTTDEVDVDSVTESYNQGKLDHIAQSIISDEEIVRTPQEKDAVNRALMAFIERLMQ